jgi:uncharacterized protein with ParB-like and HNH nuclease domain
VANIQNIDIGLHEIVKNISKDVYLIPKFQRGFVWGTSDIIDLGDSIVRGYPISSLLIMPASGTLKVGYDSLLENNYNKKQDDFKEYEIESKHYILDGQQRLTSISKLFLGTDNKKEYYFDLLAILIQKYPADNINNDSGLGIVKGKSRLNISDGFCRSFPISKDQNEQSTRHYNRFISGKSIIENKYGSVISKFLRVLKDATENNIDKYTDYLNGVLGALVGYSIPVTMISSDSELGVVIRVFEKVNSTGKKLTLFDLINAKSFQVENSIYQGGLSNYLTNKILNLLNSQNNLKSGVNSFLKFDEGEQSFEKLDRIVRIFEIADLLENDSVPSIFQSAMLEREPEFWFETWNKKGAYLLEIIYWMEEEDLIDIGQVTFLEYAIAIFIANPKVFDFPRFKKEIKKYTLHLILVDSNFSKSNLDTVEKLYAISRKMTDSHESTKYDYESLSGNPNMTKNKILECTTAKATFKAVMNILYNEKSGGLFTVDILGNNIKNKLNKDNHHIYPRSRVSAFSAGSKFNSIANIVLIDSTSNRQDIKDKSPSEYFSKISSQIQGRHYCEQNLIDIDEAINMDSEIRADLFIDNRAEKIAKIVNQYFL